MLGGAHPHAALLHLRCIDPAPQHLAEPRFPAGRAHGPRPVQPPADLAGIQLNLAGGAGQARQGGSSPGACGGTGTAGIAAHLRHACSSAAAAEVWHGLTCGVLARPLLPCLQASRWGSRRCCPAALRTSCWVCSSRGIPCSALILGPRRCRIQVRSAGRQERPAPAGRCKLPLLLLCLVAVACGTKVSVRGGPCYAISLPLEHEAMRRPATTLPAETQPLMAVWTWYASRRPPAPLPASSVQRRLRPLHGGAAVAPEPRLPAGAGRAAQPRPLPVRDVG